MHATYIDRVASVTFVTLKNKEGQADMRDGGCREQSLFDSQKHDRGSRDGTWLILRFPCTLDLSAQRTKGRRLGRQRVSPW